MILFVQSYELSDLGDYSFYVGSNSSSPAQALVTRGGVAGNYSCHSRPCEFNNRNKTCEHVAAAEYFYENEINGKICGDQYGVLHCTKPAGHAGEHRQINTYGHGATGWRNNLKPMSRKYQIEELADDIPVFAPGKRRIVVIE